MGHLLFLALVADLASTVFAADLYANRITGSDTSRGRQYTLTYISPIPAAVLWGDAEHGTFFNNDPDFDITSNYSNGQGVSTMIKSESLRGIIVSLSINDSFIYYYFPDFIGEKELPEVELESLSGDVVDYTEGVPLSYGVKYYNLSGFSSGQLSFFFKYISSRDYPVLQTATSFDPSPLEFFTNQQTSGTGNYTVMSGDVNMGSREGINLVMLSYYGIEHNMAISKGVTMAVKEEEHESPFPDGFIGLSIDHTASFTPDCRGSVCMFYCNAYGNDIVDVQVRRKNNDELMEPFFKFMNRWYMTTGYQSQAEDYGQTFVCSGRNSDGQIVERDITMYSEY